jgi:hypothetical protein
LESAPHLGLSLSHEVGGFGHRATTLSLPVRSQRQHESNKGPEEAGGEARKEACTTVMVNDDPGEDEADCGKAHRSCEQWNLSLPANGHS